VRVALTFDVEHPDGPCPPGTLEAILAALQETATRATFFLQGRWVKHEPDAARAIVAAGHRVGNHSHHHAPMDSLTDDGFRLDVGEADARIRQIAGGEPRPWFRCPFGSGMEDPRVLALLDELGYRHVGWDVDPRDWDVTRGAGDVEEAVLSGLAERDADSIVLLHAWPASTGEALPRILARLTAEGTEPATVDELLG